MCLTPLQKLRYDKAVTIDYLVFQILCSGQFDYELVLKTDLYTMRHTQWYYFRVTGAVPGVTYRFRIINLLKKDSLYNYGKLNTPFLESRYHTLRRQA